MTELTITSEHARVTGVLDRFAGSFASPKAVLVMAGRSVLVNRRQDRSRQDATWATQCVAGDVPCTCDGRYVDVGAYDPNCRAEKHGEM